MMSYKIRVRMWLRKHKKHGNVHADYHNYELMCLGCEKIYKPQFKESLWEKLKRGIS